MTRFNYILLLILVLSGCSTYPFKGSKVAKEEARLIKLERVASERQRQLSTATLDVLTAPGSPTTNVNVVVATEFARGNQSLSGIPDNRIDVKPILKEMRQSVMELNTESNKVNLEVLLQDLQVGITNPAWAGFQDSLKQDARTLSDITEAKGKVEQAKEVLVSKAAFEEKLAVKQFWKRTGFWSKILIIGGGLVALVIFVPAVLPVMGAFVSFIIGKIPGLINVLGVVGKGTFDAIIEGVGNGKKAAKDISVSSLITTDKKTFDKPEVESLLESLKDKIINTYKINLSNTTSDVDKGIVAVREQDVVGRDLKG